MVAIAKAMIAVLAVLVVLVVAVTMVTISKEKAQWARDQHHHANPDAAQLLPLQETASGCPNIKVCRKASSATFVRTHATLPRGLPNRVDANSTRIAVIARHNGIIRPTLMPVLASPRGRTRA